MVEGGSFWAGRERVLETAALELETGLTFDVAAVRARVSLGKVRGFLIAGSFVFVSSVETRLSSYRSSSSTMESRE